MNMSAKFDENPAMTLQDIKETKHQNITDRHTDGQLKNRIPTTNKVWGGGGGIKMQNYPVGRVKVYVPVCL